MIELDRQLAQCNQTLYKIRIYIFYVKNEIPDIINGMIQMKKK